MRNTSCTVEQKEPLILTSKIFAFILKISLLLCMVEGCTGPSLNENQEAQRPNIVYILADDLGYGDLACYNASSKIKTPHIDELAKRGMRFTDMHSPSSVCTPTRYGILTGRYCWRGRLPSGVLRGYGRTLIEENRLTVASMLKENGYFTGVVGKWHLGVDWKLKKSMEEVLNDPKTQVNDYGLISEMDPTLIDFDQNPTRGPRDYGFDYSFILPASLDMDPYCYLENHQLTVPLTDYTEGNDLNTGYTGAFWRAGLMNPDFQFDQVLPNFRRKASTFIEQAADGKEPFFLYLPLAAPHTPWMPLEKFEDASEAGSYGDFVQMVDEEVGSVLHTLDQLGLSDNTLVIFTSDNGPFWTPALIEEYQHRSAGNLRGMKADAYEGGHRIPYIARWPGQIQPESQSGVLSSLTHLTSTIADILGVTLEANEAEDSESILPHLLGTSEETDESTAIVHHSSKAYFALRKDQWKLIEGLGSGGFSVPSTVEPIANGPKGQLYNLIDDPLEINNLYTTEPERVAELGIILQNIRKQ